MNPPLRMIMACVIAEVAAQAPIDRRHLMSAVHGLTKAPHAEVARAIRIATERGLIWKEPGARRWEPAKFIPSDDVLLKERQRDIDAERPAVIDGR